MWSVNDRVEIRVPQAQRSLYGDLHLMQGVIEILSLSGRIHVALNNGGTAVLDPRWLYVPKKSRRSRSKTK